MSEQAKRRNKKSAIHAEELFLVGDSQFEGAGGLAPRNKTDHNKNVGVRRSN